MDRSAFSVSSADQEILGTQFHVRDPQSLPGMRRDIPKDLEVEAVEFAYEVDAPPTERQRWIRCCECKRDRNHRRGFVLRFVDQTRATLGRDCGQVKHNLDFDELIKDFDERMKRAGLLRQALTMVERVWRDINDLQRLRADPTVLACLRLKVALESKLPEVARRLESASNGHISGKVRTRDLDAEMQRDARLDKKLDSAARRSGRSRDKPGVDRELLAELAASGDKDAAKQPITKLETRTIHTFRGHQFYSVLPRVSARTQALEARLLEFVSGFRGKTSGNFSNHDIENARKKYFEVIDAAIKLTDEVEEAFAFVAPDNIAGIVRALNRFTKPESPNQLQYRQGVLYRTHAPNEPLVDTRLPPFTLAASYSRSREEVMDAYASSPPAS